jgi:hypothetical protein
MFERHLLLLFLFFSAAVNGGEQEKEEEEEESWLSPHPWTHSLVMDSEDMFTVFWRPEEKKIIFQIEVSSVEWSRQ